MINHTEPVSGVRKLNHFIIQAAIFDKFYRFFLNVGPAVYFPDRVTRDFNLNIDEIIVPWLQSSGIVGVLKDRRQLLKLARALVAQNEGHPVESTQCPHNQPTQIDVHRLLPGRRKVPVRREIVEDQKVVDAVHVVQYARGYLCERMHGVLLECLELLELFRNEIVKVDFVAKEVGRAEGLAATDILGRRLDDQWNVE
jgi:hypothetical protein